jgi:hypothetical protein
MPYIRQGGGRSCPDDSVYEPCNHVPCATSSPTPEDELPTAPPKSTTTMTTSNDDPIDQNHQLNQSSEPGFLWYNILMLLFTVFTDLLCDRWPIVAVGGCLLCFGLIVAGVVLAKRRGSSSGGDDYGSSDYPASYSVDTDLITPASPSSAFDTIKPENSGIYGTHRFAFVLCAHECCF